MNKEFDAVLFDIGSTLRFQIKDKNISENAVKGITRILGVDTDPYEFVKFLDYRYAGYRKYVFDTMREATEYDLWAKWLAPEFPRDIIERNKRELTNYYRTVNGPREMVKDGREVITTLYERGYKLGIISNLISSTEIPEWLEEEGLSKYFGTVLTSADIALRKPDPAIYLEAAGQLGIPPERCAYVGDNVDRDVTGAKGANYGLIFIFNKPEVLAKKKITDENRPDAYIYEFKEVLDIFPEKPKANLSFLRTGCC